MKATELRVGNWVRPLLSKEPIQVYPHAFAQIAKDNPTLEVHGWEPIPLTEEWLIKLGFEKCFTTISGKQHVSFEIGCFSISELSITDGRMYVNNCIAPVKYAHQLQNLYYALTSEELTVQS